MRQEKSKMHGKKARKLKLPIDVEREKQHIKTNLHRTQRLTLLNESLPGMPSGPPSSNGIKRTQAFGRINFKKNVKPNYEPPYICVTDGDAHGDLWKLLHVHWQLPKPKLVISIVGGAGKFEFDTIQARDLFTKSLLELATTTDAWIITSGSNNGASETIGSAIRKHIEVTGSTSVNDIVLLGITAWDSVSSNERLCDMKGEGCYPAVYPITEIAEKTDSKPYGESSEEKTEPLDPNHSHFILVKDGSKNKHGWKIEWRAEFEKFLASHVLAGIETTADKEEESKKTFEVHTPLVQLLVNGDDDSLNTCAKNLPVPLVAVAGSGGAATVVTLLHQLFQKQASSWRPDRTELQQIYVQAMQKEPDNDVLQSLQVIAGHHKAISVFDLMLGADTEDAGLDRAILSAFYPKDDLDVSKMKALVETAIAWNHVEYARNEIFNEHHVHYRSLMREKDFLHEIAFKALLEDLPDFVELFLKQGLDLSELLTSSRLKELYEKSMERGDGFSVFVSSLFKPSKETKQRSCCFQKSYNPSKDYMYRIGGMLKDILGYTYPNIYKTDEHGNYLIHDEPTLHLFIWAILFNREELAKLFWRLSEDHIAAAIVGSSILRGMYRKSDHQEGIDVTSFYLTNSQKFEKLAIDILQCCWDKSKPYTSDLLVREIPNWGNTTVLSMAYHGEMEEFLAQPACYTKLAKVWRGDIALRTRMVWIMLFAVLPFTVFLLKFVRKRDGDQRMDERQDNAWLTAEVTEENLKPSTKYNQLISVTLLGGGENEISFLAAICRGYRSPIVNFIFYTLFFIGFLFAYSVFMLSELKPYSKEQNSNRTHVCVIKHCCINYNFGCLEILTYCYVFASLLEEIRQIFCRGFTGKGNFKLKLKVWRKDVWNIADSLAYVIFIIAIILRYTVSPLYFDSARWLYCVSYMVFVIRFFQIFYAVEQLGPKIIMIRKMLVDLLFFVIILLMTILIFGVTTQSILSPESEVEWFLVNNVVYRPYFQMYGELFVEEYEGFEAVLLALYLVLTNVLLLNLLIAMFSHTFAKVQERAEILWKYHTYAVVHEHFDRIALPFFGTIIQMIRCGYSRTHPSSSNSDFQKKLGEKRESAVTMFVNACMEECERKGSDE